MVVLQKLVGLEFWSPSPVLGVGMETIGYLILYELLTSSVTIPVVCPMEHASGLGLLS